MKKIEIEKRILVNGEEVLVLAEYCNPKWEEAGYDDEFGFVSQGFTLFDYKNTSFKIAGKDDAEYREIIEAPEYGIISEIFEEEYKYEIEEKFNELEQPSL